MATLQPFVFVLAIALLGGAALRVATGAFPRGVARFLAVFTLVAAWAIVSVELLSLLGLAASPVAHLLLIAAAWAASRALPPPQLRIRDELRSALPSRRARVLAGAGAGTLLAACAWCLWNPVRSFDGMTYHAATVVAWINDGSVFTQPALLHDFPTTAYPVANEMALTWAVALAGTLTPLVLWTPVLAAVLMLAGWTGLRAIGVPAYAAILAPLAVVLSVIMVRQVSAPNTDLPTVAWLVVGAALLAAARSPAGTALAVLALALAVGTKTSALPLAAAGLAFAAWRLRGRPGLLAAVAAPALVIGGFVYARNLVQHGSPLWPFLATPWGDPRPPVYDALARSLLERPVETLEGRLGAYRADLSSASVLLPGAVIVAAVTRRREVVLGALFVVMLTMLWSAGPVTGVLDEQVFHYLAMSALRYLFPVVALAAAVVALATRVPGHAGRLAGVLLALAVLYDLRRLWRADDFELLPLWVLVAGAAAGLVLMWAPRSGVLVVPGIAAALAVMLVGAPDITRRHADSVAFDAKLLRWAMREPDRPSAAWSMAPVVTGLLAGHRVQRRLELIPPGESCARTRRRLRRQYVVVGRWDTIADFPTNQRLLTSGKAFDCMASLPPAYSDERFRAYRPLTVAR